jgi:hypothetical protein
MYGGIKILL